MQSRSAKIHQATRYVPRWAERAVFRVWSHAIAAGGRVRANYAFSDYKALVCVFMYGGNDGFNTVVPYTSSAFNGFYGASGVRPQLALTRAQLHQRQ